jgi:hypothetical protein
LRLRQENGKFNVSLGYPVSKEFLKILVYILFKSTRLDAIKGATLDRKGVIDKSVNKSTL